MKLTYKEILGLKGKTLIDTRWNREHVVTSVTKNNIVLDKGITIKTIIFYETSQANYELKESMVDHHTKVLKAVMERYGGLSTLKMAMWEDEDTVLVNIADDLNDELDEEEILTIIRKLLS